MTEFAYDGLDDRYETMMVFLRSLPNVARVDVLEKTQTARPVRIGLYLSADQVELVRGNAGRVKAKLNGVWLNYDSLAFETTAAYVVGTCNGRLERSRTEDLVTPMTQQKTKLRSLAAMRKVTRVVEDALGIELAQDSPVDTKLTGSWGWFDIELDFDFDAKSPELGDETLTVSIVVVAFSSIVIDYHDELEIGAAVETVKDWF